MHVCTLVPMQHASASKQIELMAGSGSTFVHLGQENVTSSNSVSMQVHLLFHGAQRSHQEKWQDFLWTAGRQLVQQCNVSIADVGAIKFVDVIACTKVRQQRSCCLAQDANPNKLEGAVMFAMQCTPGSPLHSASSCIARFCYTAHVCAHCNTSSNARHAGRRDRLAHSQPDNHRGRQRSFAL